VQVEHHILLRDVKQPATQLVKLHSNEAGPLTRIPLKFDPAKEYRCLSVVEWPVRLGVGTGALILQILQLHVKESLANLF
jgi:hypothetical protein